MKALVIALIVLGMAISCQSELIMVYSIQRHGARNVLPKSSLLAESEAAGGPTLLPEGQRQCYEAGYAFHQRYINPDTCNSTQSCLAPDSGIQYGVLGRPGVGFSNYNTYANTSALDRTIMSADSFLMGVFPPTNNATAQQYVPTGDQVVPVYSVADSEDWKIRGYTKCPAYQLRLEQWLGSDEFKAKEAESKAFRDTMQQLVPQLNVSLANWWNVYDAFNVWRTYQVGEAMPDIDAGTFNKTVELAMWLETSKMAPELTTNLLGGGLLGDMLARMAAAQQAVSTGSQGYYRLLSVSSHYNTQLGLLSALQLGEQQTNYRWRTKIPSLAAVLVFELHADPAAAAAAAGPASTSWSGLAVRAVYQDGPKAAYAVLPLPCAVQGDPAAQLAGPGSCTLERFRALAGPQALNTSSSWCEACRNDKVLACSLMKMERQLAAVGVDPSLIYASGESVSAPLGVYGAQQGSSNLRSPGMVAVWCILSVVCAGLLGAAALFAVRRHKQHQQQKQQAQVVMSHMNDFVV